MFCVLPASGPCIPLLAPVSNPRIRVGSSQDRPDINDSAIAFSSLVLSSVVSIVTCAATGHELDAGILFSSLALFTLLRIPLQFLRTFEVTQLLVTFLTTITAINTAVSLNAIADAQNAIERIKQVFLADIQSEDSQKIDPQLPVALRVERASFEWELPYKPLTKSDIPSHLIDRVAETWSKALRVAKENGQGLKKTARRATHTPKGRSEKDTYVKSPTPQEPNTSLPAYDGKYLLKRERKVFELHDIDLEVPRGQLCAIVGPVGAGKSSLVQGMIGGMALRLRAAKITHKLTVEMRRMGGGMVFGGSVAYCAQTGWIHVRVVLRVPNFGDSRGSHRVLLFVTTSCLVPRTMKNNINRIARALYHNCDIIFFGDSFSALDVHVSELFSIMCSRKPSVRGLAFSSLTRSSCSKRSTTSLRLQKGGLTSVGRMQNPSLVEGPSQNLSPSSSWNQRTPPPPRGDGYPGCQQ